MVVRGEEEYAPGGLNFPGGKVEGADNADDVLEETLHREIAEEVGLEVHDEMAYLHSRSFVAEGEPVVDVVLLCRWKSGEAHAADPGEVAAVTPRRRPGRAWPWSWRKRCGWSGGRASKTYDLARNTQ
jgi:8-oxo-dGTP pyrophosphatase MutT (NUDIX family)